jgi:hypothetical protein
MMNRTKKTALAVVIVLLLCVALGFAYRGGYLWETAEQKQVDELKRQAAENLAKEKSMAERFQDFGAMQKQLASLPEQYRRQVQDSMRSMFRRDMERRIDEYFAMDRQDRRKELDKRIAEMEQMRKSFEQRSSAGGANGPTGGPSGGGGPPGPPRGGFGGGGPGLSRMLDNTRPEFRAKMSAFMHDMEKRRNELGLPPMGPPGPRPPAR